MKRAITLLVIQSAFLVGSTDSNEGFYAGKKAVNRAGQIANEFLDRANEELPKTAKAVGDEFGKGVIKGACDEVGNKAWGAKEYLGGTAAAVLAIPYAPYVLGAGAAVLTAGTAIKCTADYRQWRFRRCMNTHFSGALNDRGFPQRCESPEKRIAWWSPEMSTEAIEHYRAQRHLTQKILKGSAQPS